MGIGPWQGEAAKGSPPLKLLLMGFGRVDAGILRSRETC